MKIFISMGFKGRSHEEIIKRKQEILEDYKHQFPEKCNMLVIDNYTKHIPDRLHKKQELVWCLGDSICLMATADIIIFDWDYKHFKGCIIENEIAREYGLYKLYRTESGTFV